jgi:hypothetical protein
METRRAAAARQPTLRGRADECALLDTLVDAIRRGEGRSLVLRGLASELVDHRDRGRFGDLVDHDRRGLELLGSPTPVR